MIRNILVSLDESPCGDAMVDQAIRWARHGRAELVGLGIIDEQTIRSEQNRDRDSYAAVLREEKQLQDARNRISRLTKRFAKRCALAGISYRTVEEVGQPSERISFFAEDFDLTILGRKHHFHFETQASPDETLSTVLHNSLRPVVAAGEKVPESRSVIVAYDGSPPAVRALEAFQRAELEQWDGVRVVTVADDSARASRQAEEAARFLRFFNIPAVARPLPAFRPVAEILLEQVEDTHAGMLVMGAFGRSPIAESVFGSTTNAILEHGKIRLFLHH